MSSANYLWTFRRCPYAMRARSALIVSKVNVEYHEILLKNKPQAMLDVSPKGTVPVLVTQKGQVIDESLDIMKWALAGADNMQWLGKSANESEAIEAWLTNNDKVFKPLLDRYKYFNRHPELSREEHFQAALPFLKSVEDALSAKGFLVAARMTLADAALLPFVRQFHFSDPTRLEGEELPGLRQWLSDYLESELFAEVMTKRELWAPAKLER